ncbi:MAG: hypothetical protein Q9208_003395 [Pyrenodesmia sp. 3 TL-2023]
MLAGTIVCSVGTGLLVMLDVETSTVVWVVWMVIAGFGDGMCTNMPYTAIQAILPKAIGISIGNNILISQLLSEIPKHARMIPSQAVIEAGALNLDALTDSPGILRQLRQAYGEAISAVMICATVTICVSIVATSGMQRLNIVKISRDREATNHTHENTSPVGNVIEEEEK